MNAYQYNPQQQFGGGFGGGFMPQMQAPFNPYTNQYQSPFSYQQPQQPRQQYDRFVDPESGRPTGLGDPSQMQTPFSGQQQNYGGGFGGFGMGNLSNLLRQAMPQMQQPMQAQPNYGPSQAIVGRSSQMRGTPNVMRRAEGGIASLMDDVE
jgi:hypothetical protein